MISASASALAVEPVDVGSRRELFVDRLLIDRMDDVELRLHPPVKAPRAKSPLPRLHYITVIKDGDLFRAYYRGHDPSFDGDKHSGHSGETVEYAESRDGREWTFPELGLHEVGATRKNNVILAQMPSMLHNFSPFLDTRPGVVAEERTRRSPAIPGQATNEARPNREWACSLSSRPMESTGPNRMK